MPFYEYVCARCGTETEMLQRLSDPPATECPSCHAPALTKVVSAAGFRLKGGGWYETDFKSANKKNLAGGDSGSAPVAAGDTAGKSTPDAKPAAAPSASPAPAAVAKTSTDA